MTRHAPGRRLPDGRNAYTRAERIADATVHCMGVLLALVAIPVLITLTAVFDGTGPVVASVALYGVAMVAMFAASAAYHLLPFDHWREELRRLDHATIYFKIAATQTPFAILAGGGKSWAVALVWVAAVAGAASKLMAWSQFGPVSTALYLLMGWSGLAIVWPWGAAAPLDGATLRLAMAGGLLYSVGVAFLVMERLPFHNAIWHGFVLAASFVFYAAVLTEIVLRAMAA